MISNIKSDLKCLLGILVCLFIFYPKLFLAQSGFLVADHLWQHYPWFELLWTSVREFKLPFWTPFIHCGFPIAAESQIGVFYPVNLLLCFLLPLRWAYSYLAVVHFVLSGWATYFYARQIGLKPPGAFVFAILFLFGAAYGGGYYNLTSLKTIAWFPLGLFLFEKAYEQFKWRYFIFLPFVLAMTLVAGYMQMGALCLFVFILYVFLRVFVFSDSQKTHFGFRFGICLKVAGSLLLTLVLALPQILLTYPLALLSNRAGVVEQYAYVGSMFPGALATLFFPHWNNLFRGNSVYMGIFSIFLMIAAFDQSDASLKKFLKLWCVIGIISLFLALGQWSPFYIALVKLMHFYSFRTPAKFLVFICMSLAFLGGAGFQTLWDAGQRPLGHVSRRFLGLNLFFIASAGLLFFIFKFAKDSILKIGDWFITSFLYGKVGHPHTFEKYQAKFESSVSYFLSMFTFHPWTVWNLSMIAIGIVFALSLARMKKGIRIWLVVGFIFLFADLYGFASIMFKKGFDGYNNVNLTSPVVRSLLNERQKGSVVRVYDFNYQWKLVPILPSLNMHYGYADTGAYSPFVMKRYYETIGLMGNVNDSNFPFWPELEFVLDHLNLLKLAGVSHILSLHPFVHKDLELLAEDPPNSLFLYRLKSVHSKAFFVFHVEIAPDWEAVKAAMLKPDFDPFKTLIVEQSEIDGLVPFISNSESEANISSEAAEPEFERWRVTTDHPGFFVVSNSFYSGWHASVDGKPVRIIKAYGLFQAVPIVGPGSHVVEFRFSAYHLTEPK